MIYLASNCYSFFFSSFLGGGGEEELGNVQVIIYGSLQWYAEFGMCFHELVEVRGLFVFSSSCANHDF